MNKKTIGLVLLVAGGALAAAAVANMNATYLPVSITSKLPVFPTGTNSYNAGIGAALLVVGFYLRK